MKALKLGLMGLVVVVVVAACSSEPVQGTLTPQVFGTAREDYAYDVAAYRGGVGAVVVGQTYGSLDGVNKGSGDAFIRKYNSGGVVWARQFGTSGFDRATDVAVTSTGISYVIGQMGGFAVFLRKYDANGVMQWTRQIGVSDQTRDVTLDSSGNVYVLSRNSNFRIFWVQKFNASGSLLLTVGLDGTAATVTDAVAVQVDSLGNIFVLTRFHGSRYAKLFKYNSVGTLLASPTVFPDVGVGLVYPYDLIVDSNNNLYLSLSNSYGFNGGAFIRKVNNDGAVLWTQDIDPVDGTSYPLALAFGKAGSLHVTGFVYGSYPGAGSGTIFVMQFNPANGNRFWTRQFGGNGFDEGLGIAVSDNVYVAGISTSNPNLLGKTNYCNCTNLHDAFLAQLNRFNGTILSIDQ